PVAVAEALQAQTDQSAGISFPRAFSPIGYLASALPICFDCLFVFLPRARAVEACLFPGIGPGAEKVAQQTMMEHVAKGDQSIVLLLRLAEGKLGQVERQRPKRTP